MFMMPCAKLDEDVMYIYCVKSTVVSIVSYDSTDYYEYFLVN